MKSEPLNPAMVMVYFKFPNTVGGGKNNASVIRAFLESIARMISLIGLILFQIIAAK
jgi:hypothetical protein